MTIEQNEIILRIKSLNEALEIKCTIVRKCGER